jgi:regulatory protein
MPAHTSDPERFKNLFPNNGFDTELLQQKADHLLFVHGEKDPTCPLKQAEALAKATNSEIVIVPEGNHLAADYPELPQLTNALESRNWLMTITAIKKQVKNPNRYSIFVDGKYSFSLSDIALLDSKIKAGDDIQPESLRTLKERADNDKLYNACLNYIARRMRSKWEIEAYLKRKKASPTLVDEIVNKLSKKGFIDDQKYAKMHVDNRNLLKPTSTRKLILELRSKKISDEYISSAVSSNIDQEIINLAIRN